ncbi:MAG: 3,4-dihydroxy-2-butanone-4-phosphate synthase [Phycisphaeraceae bacterium]|nr:3,4-dihydroxy-2-butanone-4-phosphate synthase [Phycisphaeraceae bacterium]
MDDLSALITALEQGKMVVLADDTQRENEGDLVIAAQHITPEAVNFMLREARGMLCVALSPEICDRLDLEPQSAQNNTQRGTAFTISVDAHHRFGISTGVSTADRARTIRLLADPDATARDFVRPGHVHPLRARDGGSLVRAGQTEGSVDLCRLAGLIPAAAIIEVLNDDGTMARRPELEKLCRKHNLLMATVADVIHYRIEREKLVRRIDEAPFQTEFGEFRLIAYESDVDPLPHVALVCGEVGRLDASGRPIELDRPILVRMHSQNLLGDVFGDMAQPSGSTLRDAMKLIQRQGEGAIVYLRHEQMGQGLLRRLQTLRPSGPPREAESSTPSNSGTMQDMEGPGKATDFQGDHPAIGRSQLEPGIRPPADKRDYGIGSQILRDLGIRQLKLITRHGFTPTALAGFGLSIEGFIDPETGRMTGD